MQHARKLTLLDEYDHEYKRLQRSPADVAKARKSVQLSSILDDNTLSDDNKIRQYVAELHRFLNVTDGRSQQQQQQQQWRPKRKRSPENINTETLPQAVLRASPSPPQRRWLRSDSALVLPPHQQPLPDDSDDNVFSSPRPTTTTSKKKTPKVRSTKAKQAKKKRRLQWIKI